MDLETYNYSGLGEEEPSESLGLEFEVKLEAKGDSLKLDQSSKISAEHIVFATHGHCSTYLTAKLSADAKLVATATSSERKEPLAEIHSSGKDIYFVIFQQPIAGIAYMEFAKAFFTYFEPKNVVLLESMPLIRYTAEPAGREARKPFLRWLSNAKAAETVKTQVPKVEVGRVVYGLVADIFSYCEMNGIPATLFIVVYVEYQIMFEEVRVLDEIKSSYDFLGKELEKKEINSIIVQTNKKLYSKNIYL